MTVGVVGKIDSGAAVDVRKAIITAAGRGQRALPLQTLVDRDGTEKSALEIIIEEVVAADVHEIGLIIAPGDAGAYAAAAGKHAAQLSFLEQPEPRGYGHALSLARTFVGDGAFLHLVSDHLYASDQPLRCAQQVVEQARNEGCSISAVQSTRETMLPYYGAVGGRRVPQRTDLYELETVLEKPTPTEAEQRLIVPGLRAGHYLCFFGIHVFTPAIFHLLTQIVANTPAGGTVQLSPALARLAERERYLALQVEGRRYNIGVKYGLLLAQLALALSGVERDHVLTQLLELFATRSQRGA
jgi:UTP--glucose-1-phosphate uridylyltransferase